MNKKFEKGKWYKLSKDKYSINDGWYIKFEDIENNIIIASEWIYTKTNKFKTKGNFGRPDDYSYTLLTDLSEIQQYLPDGHIDKIVNFLIKDKVYRYHYGDEYVIGKCYENKSLGISFGFKAIELGGKSNEYWRNGSFSASYYQTFATQEEEDWLNACIKANKFVPKDKINVKPKETVTFILPERWCIKITKENVEIVGDYFDSQSNNRCYNDDIWEGRYFHSINKSGQNISSKGSYSSNFANSSIIDGFTEITFEQFKKYVLEKEHSTQVQTKQMNFDNCKIWIGNNPELSKKVQEKLFKLGYGWNSGTKFIVSYTYGSSIFLYPDNTLCYGRYNKSNFDEEPKKEIFPEDLGITTKFDIHKVKNRITGEYYYSKFEYNNKWGEIIVKWNNEVEKNQFISLHQSYYSQGSCCTGKILSKETFRLATPEEKQWLNVCIAEGKFIDKDYALRGYDMYGKPLKMQVEKAHKFNIGDIVYLIKNTCMAAPIGSIARVKGYDSGDYLIVEWIDSKGSEQNNGEYYEEFFSKENPIKEEFKVGDWVVWIKDGDKTPYKISKIVSEKEWYVEFEGGNSKYTCPFTEIVRRATPEEINSVIKAKVSEFKVGDWVTILKSDKNWNSEGHMDKFIGRTVQITEINTEYGDLQIKFKDCESWSWQYENNHFRRATNEEILSVTHTASIDPYIERAKIALRHFGEIKWDSLEEPLKDPEEDLHYLSIDPVKPIIKQVPKF